MTERDVVYGLVLAGGRSTRMGRDKALLRVNGQTQLSRAVRLLERFVERVYVSTRPDQQDEPERRSFHQIVDAYRDLGPIAGILSAMREHPGAAWLVLACDLPNVDALTIQTLLDRRSAKQPFTAYRSDSDGLPEPLCAYYASGSADVIQAFVDQGIVCPRKMLISSDTRLLDQPNPGALHNVNTPEDLASTGLEARP